ncbi:MAG: phage tail tape measure protein [Bacilli bacterium]|nr:phage tail tape measure protein [Bacilli bacterium]
MDKNYSVKIGITLDDKSVSNIKKEIENKLSNEKIEIKIDTSNLSDLSTKLNNVNTQLTSISKQDSFKQTSSSAKKAKEDTNKLNASLEQTQKHIKNATFATGNWAYSWSKAMQSFLTYMSVTQLFNTFMNGVRDMISQVKELDDALVELQKVTDLEGESLDRFVDKAYEAGKTVAKTGTEMIEAATAFAKAGFKDDALELGTVAAMYTNIADEAISAADAADMIISQMKAFNIEAGDTMHIIDAINEVSNNFAVSSADISRNLGKASAVMANAGNSMEQYIGLMTAATEVTRNASKAANGLKTLTLRLQGMNDEGEKDIELTAQMEGLFKKLGISVYDTNGELKNTYDILATLAPVYQTLSNAEKAFVTETIAGKYQAQNAAAILSNWQTAVDATTTALNSNGSAARENEKVLDSIQGHLQKLNSAWEELSKNIFNSDALKFIVDLGTGFLDFANSGVGQAIIKLTALLVIFKTASGLLSTAQTKVLLLTNSVLRNTIAVVANKKAIQGVNQQTRDYITKLLLEKGAIDKTTGSINTQTLAKIKAKLASEGLSKAEQAEILKTITMTATQQAAAKATITFSGAMKGLAAAMAANPIGAILVAVTALVSGLKYLCEEADRAQERFENLQQEFQDAKQKVEETNDELKTTKDRIKELKTKGSLTFTEQAELDKLENANKKLETQAKLYERIAEAKEKATKQAANDAFNAEYNSSWSYRKINNKGEIEDTDWTDYVLPWKNIPQIYHAINGDLSDYGYDEDIINKAVDAYLDLANAESLTAEEAEKMTNLENSLAKELESLEERIPNLTGTALTEAQELRDYIVHMLYPAIYQEEQTNKFFGIDPDDKEAQKIKEQFKDIQEQMDSLYQKGELTSKKIWELRKDADGQWNDLDKYMRDNFLDNESIIKYYEGIYKSAEESSEKEIDAYRKAAEAREAAGTASMTDKSFLGYLSGEYQTNATTVLEWYDALKRLADGGELSADSIRKLDEEFKFLANDEYALEDIAGILDYFSSDAQDTLSNYSTELDNITKQYNMLTAAVDEYNEAGYLSSETLANIINNGLLDYLSYENGQLIANTGELYNSAEASRIYASQQLTAAMTADMLHIAMGEEAEVSGLAASAIANLGNSSEVAGNQAANSVGKFISFAEAVDQANKALAGKELTSDIQNKISAVQGAYKPYYDLLSKPIQINSKKYTGSGSGSGKKSNSGSSAKSQKEWWETALSDLKDQFDNNEITVDQYINSLQNLLGKVGQGTEAWRKINKELQKQKLDKVKDDYDAGRISLNQYIISLQNLQKAYAAGTDAWNDLAKAIKKAKLDKLKEQQSDLKSALSAVTDTLDKQIDKYEELKDAADEKYDSEIDKLNEVKDQLDDDVDDYERAQKAVVKFLNEQLDAINNQKDNVENYYTNVIEALEKQNEEQQEAIDLAEAYDALINAMTQKTKKVYREGLGKKLAEYKDNYIGQMLGVVKTEVRLNLRWCVYG